MDVPGPSDRPPSPILVARTPFFSHVNPRQNNNDFEVTDFGARSTTGLGILFRWFGSRFNCKPLIEPFIRMCINDEDCRLAIQNLQCHKSFGKILLGIDTEGTIIDPGTITKTDLSHWQEGFPRYPKASQNLLSYIQISSPYNVHYIFRADTITKQAWNELHRFLTSPDVVLVGYDITHDIERMLFAFGENSFIHDQLGNQLPSDPLQVTSESLIFKKLQNYAHNGADYTCIDLKRIIDRIEIPNQRGMPNRASFLKRGIHFEGKKLCHVINAILGIDVTGLQVDFKKRATRSTFGKSELTQLEQLYMMTDAFGPVLCLLGLIHAKLVPDIEEYFDLNEYDVVSDIDFENQVEKLLNFNKIYVAVEETNTFVPFWVPIPGENPDTEEILVDPTRFGKIKGLRQIFRNETVIRIHRARMPNSGNVPNIDPIPIHPASQVELGDQTPCSDLPRGIWPEPTHKTWKRLVGKKVKAQDTDLQTADELFDEYSLEQGETFGQKANFGQRPGSMVEKLYKKESQARDEFTTQVAPVFYEAFQNVMLDTTATEFVTKLHPSTMIIDYFLSPHSIGEYLCYKEKLRLGYAKYLRDIESHLINGTVTPEMGAIINKVLFDPRYKCLPHGDFTVFSIANRYGTSPIITKEKAPTNDEITRHEKLTMGFITFDAATTYSGGIPYKKLKSTILRSYLESFLSRWYETVKNATDLPPALKNIQLDEPEVPILTGGKSRQLVLPSRLGEVPRGQHATKVDEEKGDLEQISVDDEILDKIGESIRAVVKHEFKSDSEELEDYPDSDVDEIAESPKVKADPNNVLLLSPIRSDPDVTETEETTSRTVTLVSEDPNMDVTDITESLSSKTSKTPKTTEHMEITITPSTEITTSVLTTSSETASTAAPSFSTIASNLISDASRTVDNQSIFGNPPIPHQDRQGTTKQEIMHRKQLDKELKKAQKEITQLTAQNLLLTGKYHSLAREVKREPDNIDLNALSIISEKTSDKPETMQVDINLKKSNGAKVGVKSKKKKKPVDRVLQQRKRFTYESRFKRAYAKEVQNRKEQKVIWTTTEGMIRMDSPAILELFTDCEREFNIGAYFAVGLAYEIIWHEYGSVVHATSAESEIIPQALRNTAIEIVHNWIRETDITRIRIMSRLVILGQILLATVRRQTEPRFRFIGGARSSAVIWARSVFKAAMRRSENRPWISLLGPPHETYDNKRKDNYKLAREVLNLIPYGYCSDALENFKPDKDEKKPTERKVGKKFQFSQQDADSLIEAGLRAQHLAAMREVDADLDGRPGPSRLAEQNQKLLEQAKKALEELEQVKSSRSEKRNIKPKDSSESQSAFKIRKLDSDNIATTGKAPTGTKLFDSKNLDYRSPLKPTNTVPTDRNLDQRGGHGSRSQFRRADQILPKKWQQSKSSKKGFDIPARRRQLENRSSNQRFDPQFHTSHPPPGGWDQGGLQRIPPQGTRMSMSPTKQQTGKSKIDNNSQSFTYQFPEPQRSHSYRHETRYFHRTESQDPRDFSSPMHRDPDRGIQHQQQYYSDTDYRRSSDRQDLDQQRQRDPNPHHYQRQDQSQYYQQRHDSPGYQQRDDSSRYRQQYDQSPYQQRDQYRSDDPRNLRLYQPDDPRNAQVNPFDVLQDPGHHQQQPGQRPRRYVRRPDKSEYFQSKFYDPSSGGSN